MVKNSENLPKHIAIIPDGNRRWARSRGLAPWKGHEAGAKNLEKIISFALEKDIYCMSFWGSSLENLRKRPLSEKRALLSIYKKYFLRMIDGREIYENEVKVNVIGRWEEQFPGPLKEVIKKILARTKNYKKRILNLLLAYSGTDEIMQAIQNISKKYESGTKITAKIIKENLLTPDIPTV